MYTVYSIKQYIGKSYQVVRVPYLPMHGGLGLDATFPLNHYRVSSVSCYTGKIHITLYITFYVKEYELLHLTNHI
jgi:hypothetical protein